MSTAVGSTTPPLPNFETPHPIAVITLVEGVREVHGAAVNQVANIEHALVTSRSGARTSGLVLGVA